MMRRTQSSSFAGTPPRNGEDQETAYAKINLALHVRGRRADGYHDLETVFAFVDAGDVLTVTPADADSVRISGEFAASLGTGADNIVLQALADLPHGPGWAVHLDKRLPVAAGLGGGSADAGAVFRLIERMHGLPVDWQAIAARLGADVPACVRSVATIGHGTGTHLDAVVNDLAGTPVLLVNPRVPLATGPVFRGWDGIDRGPLPQGDLRAIAREGRNDLEPGAIVLVPAIADVLAWLAQTGAWLVRMSGSGATCFALYDDVAARDAAAAGVPGAWWHLAGELQ
jgi:4-diphosphocytidyl-2-C-methyl-D-erythritol kinase